MTLIEILREQGPPGLAHALEAMYQAFLKSIEDASPTPEPAPTQPTIEEVVRG